MTPEQIAYVASRRSQIRYWPWLALVLLLLLAAGYGWLWWHAPLNINPLLVLEQFHHPTLADEEMILLAARGSLALLGCGVFLLLILVLISLALWNEHRLIRILDEVTTGGAVASGEEAAPEPILAAGEGGGPERRAEERAPASGAAGEASDGSSTGVPPAAS